MQQEALFDQGDLPTPPESILDARESRRQRDLAIARVDRGTDAEWKEAATSVVYHLCRTMPVFTPDDIWATGLPKPREPRALGPIMLRAARERWCQKTGRYVASKAPTQHQNVIAEWESLIIEGV